MKCEFSIKAADQTIREQGELITKLKAQNAELVKQLATFKDEISSRIAEEVEKIKEDLKFKHAFIVVHNKHLQNQVIAQKAEKAALVTQIEGVDHRITNLELAVGHDD